MESEKRRKVKIHLSTILGKQRKTQKWLAEKTSIRRTTISYIYNECAESVKFEHLVKICDALNCSLHELMEYEPESKK